MDTRKVTLVATIAVIALVAVGIGYAYTAMTTNTSNNTASEYVTLVQDGEGAYTFAPLVNSKPQAVFWDTVDAKEGSKYITTFSLTDDVIQNYPINNINSVQIGQPFTIVTDIETPKTAGDMTNLACAITTTGVAAPSTYQIDTNGDSTPDIISEAAIYFVVSSTGEADQLYKFTDADTISVYQNSSWVPTNTFTIYQVTSQKSYLDATITVYYGFTSTGVKVEHAKGASPDGPAAAPIDASSWNFKVTENGSNTVIAPTALSLNSNSVSVAKGGSDNSTIITFAPKNADTVNKKVTLECVGGSGVTAEVDGSKVVIKATANATGPVTITIKSVADPTKTATLEVTVTDQ